MKSFFVTLLDCNNTSQVNTIEIGMEDNKTSDDARALVLSTCRPEDRVLIYSVYDDDTLRKFAKAGIPVPKEIYRYYGYPDENYDSQFVLKNSEVIPPNPHPGEISDEDWKIWYLNNPSEPTDNNGEEEDDDDDGDEWKNLIK